MRRDEMLSMSGSSRDGVGPGAVQAEGLSIFDGHRRGGFHMRILGYDRAQVEEHIRQLEQALAYTRALNRQLDRQLAQLREQLAERSRVHVSERAAGDAAAAPAGENAPSE